MGKAHYIEELKRQLHEIMERPVTLGRAEEVTVYADAICALHKLDDDHFREATKKLYDVELLRAVAAAVVVTAVIAVASCVLVRGRDCEGRNRARVIIRQLPAHVVTQIERLCVLACRKLHSKAAA